MGRSSAHYTQCRMVGRFKAVSGDRSIIYARSSTRSHFFILPSFPPSKTKILIAALSAGAASQAIAESGSNILMASLTPDRKFSSVQVFDSEQFLVCCQGWQDAVM